MEIEMDSLKFVGLLFPALFVLELATGAYGKARMSGLDRWINAVCFAQDRLVQPSVVLLSAAIWTCLLPDSAGALEATPFWLGLGIYALAHEFLHYWFHRWAHTWAPLWRIHRAHHTATEMSVIVAPRAHVAWQALLPIHYFAGLAIHLGLFEIVAITIAVRVVVGTLGHSTFRPDLVLLESPSLRWITWPLERVFTTPDAHHAHHGIGLNGAPNGNFGSMLIVWDVLFGTYYAPHQRQSRIGVDDGEDDHWLSQLYWPLPSLFRRLFRPVSAGLVLFAVTLGCLGCGTTPANTHPPQIQAQAPSGLNFYNPPTPLPAGPSGTVIWARTIEGPPDATTWLVLYKSLSLNNEETAVSGWIIVPDGRPSEGERGIVAWAHGSKGIADRCAPTRQSILTRSPGLSFEGVPLLSNFLEAGLTVVATDYEGLGTPGRHPYGVGESEARSILDIIRAAPHLDSSAGGRAVILGFSQGGRSAVFANEFAPSYAPDVEITGVVGVGAAVASADPEQVNHLLNTGKAGLIIMGLAGHQAAFGEELAGVKNNLTPLAIENIPALEQVCLQGAVEHFESFTPTELFLSSSRLLHSGLLRPDFGDAPGYRRGAAPILLIQGGADRYIPTRFIHTWAALVAETGQDVVVRQYDHAGHDAFSAAGADIIKWVTTRLGQDLHGISN